MRAWEAASSLVRRYAAPGPYEFIPLAQMRDSYPPLPLPHSSIAIVDPLKAGVDAAYATSIAGFTTSLYAEKLKELEARLSSLSGSRR